MDIWFSKPVVVGGILFSKNNLVLTVQTTKINFHMEDNDRISPVMWHKKEL